MDLIRIWKKVNKPVTTAAVIFLLLLLFVLLTGQKSVSPSNPMDEQEADASTMYLTSSTLAMDESLLDGVENANISSGTGDGEQEDSRMQQADVTPEPEKEQTEQEEVQQEQPEDTKEPLQQETNPDTSPVVDSLITLIQKNEDSKQNQQKNNTEQNGSEDGSVTEDSTGESGSEGSGQHSTLSPDASSELFTTSIVDGERRTESDYYFTITLTAKGKAQNLISQTVTVNGTTRSFTNGDHIVLQEGANSIVVTLRFRDKNYNQIDAPTKSYTVYYVPENTYFLQVQNADTGEIYANGATQNIGNGNLNLLVQAMQGDKNTSVRVRLNNATVTAGSNGIYQMQLKVGTNTIKATTGTGVNQKVIEFTLNYQPDAFTLTMESAAITESVKEGRFGGSTYAEYAADSPQFAFRISCSDVTGLEGIDSISVTTRLGTTEMVHMTGADGYIQCNLDTTQATNIKVTCRDSEGVSQTFTWKIKYIYTGETPESKKPIIEASVANGEVIKSTKVVMQVHAKDYQGNYLLQQQIQVFLNGETIGYAGISGNAYEYNLNPQQGSNRLQIVAVDNEQYKAIKEITFTYAPETTNVSVTLIVDANILGLGTFIQENLTVASDKMVAEIVEERLAAHGYTTSYKGSPSGDGSGYYLVAILKPGIISNWYVSEERIAGLEAEGFSFIAPTNMDKLGEHDFTTASGWVITMDGYSIGQDMGSRPVRDGDVIHLMFTLNGGSDVNLGGGGIYG